VTKQVSFDEYFIKITSASVTRAAIKISIIKVLNLDSLELRRIRADLLLVYKILQNTEALFTLRAHTQLLAIDIC